jgi:hypothetical protein
MQGNRWRWISGLAAGLLIFTLGCHSGGKGESHHWLRVALARNVDRQFGGTIVHDPPLPQNGDGSHEGDLLKGKANLRTITQAVQYLTEQMLVPADPPGNVGKLNKPSLLLGKLEHLAAASVDNSPCRQDSDNDGIPDYKEDLNDDPVGLCTVPAAVDCKLHADNSFTVKFSHCIPVTTDFNTPWSPEAVNTFATPNAVFSTFTTITSGNTYTFLASGRYFFYRLTNTTTDGTITAPTLAYSGLTWRTGSVGCNGGTILNFQTIFTPLLYRLTATTDERATVGLIYDGAVTLQLGTAGVDEQMIRVSYNKFTRIWGDAESGSVDNSRYLTLDGQAMEYRVLTPTGAPAFGSTPFPAGFGAWNQHPNGMELEKYHVTFDPDGKDGLLPAGSYRVARGLDFEDGRFFMNDDGQIVSMKDKNGPDPADLLSSPALGLEVDGVRVVGTAPMTITFALNFYDADHPLGDGLPGNDLGTACGKPFSNTRCRVEVEVNYWMRTFNVKDVDLTTCATLWDWTATNKKYQDIAF